MKKKGKIIVMSMLALFISIFSCTTETDEESTVGNWSKTTPLKGRQRSGAVSFTIGDKAYVGLGYDGDDYLSDFYVYDVNLGFWESLGDFPGEMREQAVAFSINGKGYMGLGLNKDLDKEELKDFWEYDPETDQWTPVADFEGTARYRAIGFSIGDVGYVGTGYDGDNHNSDFWKYNPEEDSWDEIVGYPGDKIESGFGFVIDGKAYIGGGISNDSYSIDFWEFTPAADGSSVSWTRRTPSDDESYYDEFRLAVYRYDAVAITAGTKAYVVGGVSSSGAVTKDVYEFDATTFSWDQLTSYEGSARSLAVGFVLNDRIFVGTGQNGSSKYDNFWEFKPNEEYDEEY
ncbi:MAG TPA: kelch repeat-containing protein [Ohtaekwangia sp.]